MYTDNGMERARWLRDQLRMRREDLGMRQQDVADYINARLGDDSALSKATVSNWEKFKREPKLDMFVLWARALKARIRILIDDEHSERVAILLHPRVVRMARQLQELDEQQLAAVKTILSSMLPEE